MKKNGFLYPQNECNHLVLSSIVPEVKKKVHSGKSCFFPQCAFFQELPSYLKFLIFQLITISVKENIKEKKILPFFS